MLIIILKFILGFFILIAGANYLVRGASLLGKKFSIPSIVIGMIIVGFGTSVPELVISVFAVLKGSSDISISNAVGSNIANIMLVLGLMPFFMVVRADQSAPIYHKILFVIFTAFVLFLSANGKLFFDRDSNTITRSDGIIFLAIFLVFLIYTFFREKQSGDDRTTIVKQSLFFILLFILGGIGGVYFGGNLVVENSIQIATFFGISEAFIGVSILAFGSSLPEIISSIVAAMKKEEGIALGNIIGSNIFNIFLILGIASVIKPLEVSDGQQFNILMNIIASFLFLVFVFGGKKGHISKIQGMVFLALYLLFIAISFMYDTSQFLRYIPFYR
jgi:cation:H+ antiporter